MQDRFRHDLIALLGHAPDRPIALAVSGGPDSMAMLTLAVSAFPGEVIVATVDHRLRAESADEAAMVARHCAAIGVRHATLTPPPNWRPRTVQADARRLRYALLGTWAVGAEAAALLTAHHADDAAETFLMRAARGSGVAGLSGIRPRWDWDPARWGGDADTDAPALPVLRPLLGWRRAELAEIVAATATPFVTDPSNADRRFDRVRVRDMLAANPAIDATALARSAAACAEADAALTAITDLLLRERSRGAADAERYDVAGLPRELRRRLVRTAIGRVRARFPDAEGHWTESANVEALLDALEAGGTATIAGVAGRAKGAVWTFAPAPPRRSH